MLKLHRDYKRQNRANLAVQGSIYAKMNKASIIAMRDRIQDATNIQISNNPKAELLKMFDVASSTSEVSYEHFLQAQSEICSKTCDKYASEQYSSLTRCSTFNENITLVQSISKFIINDKMVGMVNNIVGNFDQSGKI